MERCIEDAAERLFAIESDMRSKDDIIAAEESVVLFDLPSLGRATIFVQALIFLFDMFFPFEDIEAGTGKGMVVKRFDQGLGVDDTAAGRIDEEPALFYLLYIFSVDEVMRVLIVRNVERHDI